MNPQAAAKLKRSAIGEIDSLVGPALSTRSREALMQLNLGELTRIVVELRDARGYPRAPAEPLKGGLGE